MARADRIVKKQEAAERKRRAYSETDEYRQLQTDLEETWNEIQEMVPAALKILEDNNWEGAELIKRRKPWWYPEILFRGRAAKSLGGVVRSDYGDTGNSKTFYLYPDGVIDGGSFPSGGSRNNWNLGGPKRWRNDRYARQRDMEIRSDSRTVQNMLAEFIGADE